MERYDISIVHACEMVNSGRLRGTGDPLSDVELEVIRDWLWTRIDTWHPTPLSFDAEQKAYDSAMLLLASSALQMVTKEIREHGEMK